MLNLVIQIFWIEPHNSVEFSFQWTMDDLLTEASRRQTEDIPFAGVIYEHQLRITVGQAIRDLSLIAEAYDPVDIANRVEFLPL